MLPTGVMERSFLRLLTVSMLDWGFHIKFKPNNWLCCRLMLFSQMGKG